MNLFEQLSQPYFFLEKTIFQPVNNWLDNLDVIRIAEKIGFILAVFVFIQETGNRKEKAIYEAWQIAQQGQGSQSRIAVLAIEKLNEEKFSLSGMNLLKTNLRGAKLRNADLRVTNLQNADLTLSNLQNTDLWSADLRNANLHLAKLEGAYLLSANLQNAIIRSADLRNANLWSANLEGAYLLSVNLNFPHTNLL